jgi:apolipoprotein N-acyltransferase
MPPRRPLPRRLGAAVLAAVCAVVGAAVALSIPDYRHALLGWLVIAAVLMILAGALVILWPRIVRHR